MKKRLPEKNYFLKNGLDESLDEILLYVTSPDFCKTSWNCVTISVGKCKPGMKRGIVHVHRTALEKENIFDIKFHRCKMKVCTHDICKKPCTSHPINSKETEKKQRETNSTIKKKSRIRKNIKSSSIANCIDAKREMTYLETSSPRFQKPKASSITEENKKRKRSKSTDGVRQSPSCILYVYSNGCKRKVSFQLHPDMERFMARALDKIEDYALTTTNQSNIKTPSIKESEHVDISDESEFNVSRRLVRPSSQSSVKQKSLREKKSSVHSEKHSTLPKVSQRSSRGDYEIITIRSSESTTDSEQEFRKSSQRESKHSIRSHRSTKTSERQSKLKRSTKPKSLKGFEKDVESRSESDAGSPNARSIEFKRSEFLKRSSRSSNKSGKDEKLSKKSRKHSEADSEEEITFFDTEPEAFPGSVKLSKRDSKYSNRSSKSLKELDRKSLPKTRESKSTKGSKRSSLSLKTLEKDSLFTKKSRRESNRDSERISKVEFEINSSESEAEHSKPITRVTEISKYSNLTPKKSGRESLITKFSLRDSKRISENKSIKVPSSSSETHSVSSSKRELVSSSKYGSFRTSERKSNGSKIKERDVKRDSEQISKVDSHNSSGSEAENLKSTARESETVRYSYITPKISGREYLITKISQKESQRNSEKRPIKASGSSSESYSLSPSRRESKNSKYYDRSSGLLRRESNASKIKERVSKTYSQKTLTRGSVSQTILPEPFSKELRGSTHFDKDSFKTPEKEKTIHKKSRRHTSKRGSKLLKNFRKKFYKLQTASEYSSESESEIQDNQDVSKSKASILARIGGYSIKRSKIRNETSTSSDDSQDEEYFVETKKISRQKKKTHQKPKQSVKAIKSNRYQSEERCPRRSKRKRSAYLKNSYNDAVSSSEYSTSDDEMRNVIKYSTKNSCVTKCLCKCLCDRGDCPKLQRKEDLHGLASDAYSHRPSAKDVEIQTKKQDSLIKGEVHGLVSFATSDEESEVQRKSEIRKSSHQLETGIADSKPTITKDVNTTKDTVFHSKSSSERNDTVQLENNLHQRKSSHGRKDSKESANYSQIPLKTPHKKKVSRKSEKSEGSLLPRSSFARKGSRKSNLSEYAKHQETISNKSYESLKLGPSEDKHVSMERKYTRKPKLSESVEHIPGTSKDLNDSKMSNLPKDTDKTKKSRKSLLLVNNNQKLRSSIKKEESTKSDQFEYLQHPKRHSQERKDSLESHSLVKRDLLSRMPNDRKGSLQSHSIENIQYFPRTSNETSHSRISHFSETRNPSAKSSPERKSSIKSEKSEGSPLSRSSLGRKGSRKSNLSEYAKHQETTSNKSYESLKLGPSEDKHVSMERKYTRKPKLSESVEHIPGTSKDLNDPKMSNLPKDTDKTKQSRKSLLLVNNNQTLRSSIKKEESTKSDHFEYLQHPKMHSQERRDSLESHSLVKRDLLSRMPNDRKGSLQSHSIENIQYFPRTSNETSHSRISHFSETRNLSAKSSPERKSSIKSVLSETIQQNETQTIKEISVFKPDSKIEIIKLEDEEPKQTLDEGSVSYKSKLEDEKPKQTVDESSGSYKSKLEDEEPKQTLDEDSGSYKSKLEDEKPKQTVDERSVFYKSKLEDEKPKQTIDEGSVSYKSTGVQLTIADGCPIIHYYPYCCCPCENKEPNTLICTCEERKHKETTTEGTETRRKPIGGKLQSIFSTTRRPIKQEELQEPMRKKSRSLYQIIIRSSEERIRSTQEINPNILTHKENFGQQSEIKEHLLGTTNAITKKDRSTMTSQELCPAATSIQNQNLSSAENKRSPKSILQSSPLPRSKVGVHKKTQTLVESFKEGPSCNNTYLPLNTFQNTRCTQCVFDTREIYGPCECQGKGRLKKRRVDLQPTIASPGYSCCPHSSIYTGRRHSEEYDRRQSTSNSNDKTVNFCNEIIRCPESPEELFNPMSRDKFHGQNLTKNHITSEWVNTNQPSYPSLTYEQKDSYSEECTNSKSKSCGIDQCITKCSHNHVSEKQNLFGQWNIERNYLQMPWTTIAERIPEQGSIYIQEATDKVNEVPSPYEYETGFGDKFEDGVLKYESNTKLRIRSNENKMSVNNEGPYFSNDSIEQPTLSQYSEQNFNQSHAQDIRKWVSRKIPQDSFFKENSTTPSLGFVIKKDTSCQSEKNGVNSSNQNCRSGPLEFSENSKIVSGDRFAGRVLNISNNLNEEIFQNDRSNTQSTNSRINQRQVNTMKHEKLKACCIPAVHFCVDNLRDVSDIFQTSDSRDNFSRNDRKQDSAESKNIAPSNVTEYVSYARSNNSSPFDNRSLFELDLSKNHAQQLSSDNISASNGVKVNLSEVVYKTHSPLEVNSNGKVSRTSTPKPLSSLPKANPILEPVIAHRNKEYIDGGTQPENSKGESHINKYIPKVLTEVELLTKQCANNISDEVNNGTVKVNSADYSPKFDNVLLGDNSIQCQLGHLTILNVKTENDQTNKTEVPSCRIDTSLDNDVSRLSNIKHPTVETVNTIESINKSAGGNYYKTWKSDQVQNKARINMTLAINSESHSVNNNNSLIDNESMTDRENMLLDQEFDYSERLKMGNASNNKCKVKFNKLKNDKDSLNKDSFNKPFKEHLSPNGKDTSEILASTSSFFSSDYCGNASDVYFKKSKLFKGLKRRKAIDRRRPDRTEVHSSNITYDKTKSSFIVMEEPPDMKKSKLRSNDKKTKSICNKREKCNPYHIINLFRNVIRDNDREKIENDYKISCKAAVKTSKFDTRAQVTTGSRAIAIEDARLNTKDTLYDEDRLLGRKSSTFRNLAISEHNSSTRKKRKERGEN